MLGCIPVLLKPINFPFNNRIDYKRFVINLNLDESKLDETNFSDLFKPYLENEKWLVNARNYIKKIRQFIQITWIYDEKGNVIDSTFKYDAYGMMLAKVSKMVQSMSSVSILNQ